MKDLNFYESLPDAVDCDFILKELDEILLSVGHSPKFSEMECVYELAIRWAENDTDLDVRRMESIARLVESFWDRNSVSSTELCLGLVINFGVQIAYDFILKSLGSLSNDDVKSEILDAIDDVGYSLRQ